MQLLLKLIAASSLLGSTIAVPQAAPLPTSAFALEGYARTNPTGSVSGGAGGPTTTVSAASALQSAVRVGTNPLNIVLRGNIALSGRLNVGSNKSVSMQSMQLSLCVLMMLLTQLIGASTGGNITRYGISITEQSNVIIRNIKFHPVTGNDQISISESQRIWIDHNEFFSDPDLNRTGPDRYVCCVEIY
ncbi:hypothetical protein S40293_11260 [Stachybotrys chartarum IBT 40293]|nr:hypothetical protein S40293_11260 [Stachybotrys chartarum IBT 40293]